MTAELYRQRRYGAEYAVVFDAEYSEFRVEKKVWSIYVGGYRTRGIGSSIKKDKPFHEYGYHDYSDMIQTAIEEEEADA